VLLLVSLFVWARGGSCGACGESLVYVVYLMHYFR
jgi:hypothetical protein